MADRKTIKDLNSLIRFDERKRLKLPSARPSIDSSIGYASVTDTVLDGPVDSIFVKHFGYVSGTNNKVYQYFADGSATVYVGQDKDVGEIGVNSLSATFDYFSGNYALSNVYKNGVYLFSPSLGDVELHVRTSSTQIIVMDNSYNVGFYDFTGSLISAISLPTVGGGGAVHAVNNECIAYQSVDGKAKSQKAVASHSGALLFVENYVNVGYMSATGASKSAVYFVDATEDGISLHINVVNNIGSKIGTYVINISALEVDLGGYFSTAGFTDTSIYFVGSNTAGGSNVVIYSHTLTMSGSVATGAVLGAITQVTPCEISGHDWYPTYQFAAMDSALFA